MAKGKGSFKGIMQAAVPAVIIGVCMVGTAAIMYCGVTQSAKILGRHLKEGIAEHLAGENLLATGLEHLASAVRDRKR